MSSISKDAKDALDHFWHTHDNDSLDNEVVIVSGCRTAIGTFGGTLKDSNAVALASTAGSLPPSCNASSVRILVASGLQLSSRD